MEGLAMRGQKQYGGGCAQLRRDCRTREPLNSAIQATAMKLPSSGLVVLVGRALGWLG